MNMQEFNFENQNLEEEIQVLEKRLEEKKKALSGEKRPEEKEFLKGIVIERAREVSALKAEKKIPKPVSGIKKTQAIPISLAGKISLKDLKSLSPEKQLDILIGIALSESIFEAANLAQQLDNPYILDEFHDTLVDRFYDELVKRGRI